MDEKTLLPHVALPPASGPAGTPRLSSFLRRTWLAGASTIALLLLLFLLSPLQHHLGPCRSHQHELKGIKRSPNATLEWVPCADSPALFCSTLVVPLNWLEPLKNETAEIFLKMYPAANEKRIGSMLINPGGPGGSGNYFAERAGASLSILTGGVYDIVGFDPRGVNMTAPYIGAASDNWEADLFGLEHHFEFSSNPAKQVNLTDPAVYKEQLRLLRHQDAASGLINDAIRQHTLENERKSVSTAFVVRDMVAIVDALGDGDVLTYWGFSYGTILGATFAAMMPDRVGKMVLDGVSHAGDYTSGLEDWGWSSMTDSNAVLDEFYRSCAAAGPSRCALAAAKDTTASSKEAALVLKAKVDDLLDRLWETPLPVRTSDYGAGLLKASQVHAMIFQALYSPANWAATADALASAIEGNGTLARNMASLPDELYFKHPERKGLTDNVFHRRVGGSSNVPTTAILCSDEEQETEDLDELLRRSVELRERSFTAPEWTSLMLTCRTWKDRPFERYVGPWTLKDGLRQTKNKVLWVGNTYDPVTPLASAKRMAEGFGRESGSLLIQDGRGHCTLAEPSLCSIKAIQSYLVNGTVPAWGTVCVSEDNVAFPDKEEMRVLAQDDEELMQAAHRVREVLGFGSVGMAV